MRIYGPPMTTLNYAANAGDHYSQIPASSDSRDLIREETSVSCCNFALGQASPSHKRLADTIGVVGYRCAWEREGGIVSDPIEKRMTELREWLLKKAPDCFERQLHLDEGSSEQVYWHYGYLAALNDLVNLSSEESLN